MTAARFDSSGNLLVGLLTGQIIEIDGDVDLISGSFVHHPSPVPDAMKQRWVVEESTDLLLLLNPVK